MKTFILAYFALHAVTGLWGAFGGKPRTAISDDALQLAGVVRFALAVWIGLYIYLYGLPA